jgi:hypothetical protein
MCQQFGFFVQIMMYSHLLDLSSSSLLVALGRSRLVHANKDALVAHLAGTLPVTTALSGSATADIAEVYTARLANHVVAATSMLNSALATRAHLPVDASGEADHSHLRSCNPPGSLGNGAVLDVVPDIRVVVDELGPALHAPVRQARATVPEHMRVVRDVDGERADEHGGGKGVAVQAEWDGSLPLALLHVEETYVQVVLLGTTEQGWSERGGMQCRGGALHDARVSVGRGDQHVHAALQTPEAELEGAIGVGVLFPTRFAIAGDALQGGTGSVGHCCLSCSGR